MRRGFVVLLLLSVLGGIAWWLWGWYDGQVQPQRPSDHLPATSAVILEIPDPVNTWQRFISTSQLWAAWDSLPGCAAVTSLVVRAGEAAVSDAALQKAIRASTLWIAIAPNGDDLGVVLIWAIPSDAATLARAASLVDPSLGAASPMWKTDARVPVRPDEQLAPLFARYANGLIFLSTDEALCDAAAAPIAKGTTLAALDTTFRNALSSHGPGSDGRLWVHTARAQRMLTRWVSPQAFATLDATEGWLALDMRSRPEALLLSGLLFPQRMGTTLRAAAQEETGRVGITRVLHPDVREFLQVNISDPLRYCAAALGHAPDEALFATYGAWALGSVGRAFTGTGQDTTLAEWAVLRADDPGRARAALEARCEGCDTLAYRGIRMVHSRDTSALAAVWGPLFEGIEHPWWCVLNDRVVFTDQLNALRLSINAWTDGYSLAQDARSSSSFQRYASDATATWWCDVRPYMEALRAEMKPEGRSVLAEHRRAWQQLGGCLVQLTPEANGSYQITASLSASPGTTAAGSSATVADGALWSVSLGAPAQRGPWLLTDHLSRTKQILVQDAKNRISLISCTGKLLWQREVDGPVMGDVHQVDKFKNGKLQMLFNTATRIYLIDRNGKDVEHFPITLPEQASAPLNVFDYDGKREYRILVPTVEARLLNFDANGKPVEGWAPPKTANTCEVPVAHVRMRGKDHLVLVDKAGHITMVDRRGGSPTGPKLDVKGAQRLIGLVPAADIGDLALLWSDAEGHLLSGRFSGGIDTVRTRTGTPATSILAEAMDPLPEHAAVAKGVLFYPSMEPLAEGVVRTLRADINLDGRSERILVGLDGHVEVSSAP